MSVASKPHRPLGRKAYGSIGHVAGSRLGPGDHSVNESQSATCTRSAASHLTVYCQAKLDGSCVAAARLDDGSIVALGRAGYLASSSTYEMHHLWADWVAEHEHRFAEVLEPGERLVGEWLAQAHGTVYDLNGREPFVAFDLMTDSTRAPMAEFVERVADMFAVPDMIEGPIAPELAFVALDHYGADRGEGVMYRVEGAKGGGPTRVNFLAKWVRHDKADGVFLSGDPVWNWHPEHAPTRTPHAPISVPHFVGASLMSAQESAIVWPDERDVREVIGWDAPFDRAPTATELADWLTAAGYPVSAIEPAGSGCRWSAGVAGPLLANGECVDMDFEDETIESALVQAVCWVYDRTGLIGAHDALRREDRPEPVSMQTATERHRWYVGAQNDGCFIIDRPPRPSNDDVVPDRCDGPTKVIPLGTATPGVLDLAQAICDAHNMLIDGEAS